MKENEELLEEIQRAFYDVVDVVETNLPETTGDEDVDQLIQEQLDQCNNAIVRFQMAYKVLKEEMAYKVLKEGL